MDYLSFFSEIIKSIAWPLTVFFLVLLLRSPLSNLIQLIFKIKYKDLEIWFNQEIAGIKSEIPPEEIAPAKEKRIEEDEKIKTSPVHSMLKSWQEIEQTIYTKFKELFPPDSLQYKRLTPERAYNELLLSGALSPSSENMIQKLHIIRNRLAHSPEHSISPQGALEYIALSKLIKKKIEALTELPTVKLTPLTYMILAINHLIDTGKYNDISIDDIEKKIDDGTILNYLKEKAGNDIDLSLILNGTTYPGFENFYIENLQSLYNAYSGNERRKWLVENSGLCLLLAWTNEIIQQGSGWHPS